MIRTILIAAALWALLIAGFAMKVAPPHVAMMSPTSGRTFGGVR